jgi:hypothetical protein
LGEHYGKAGHLRQGLYARLLLGVQYSRMKIAKHTVNRFKRACQKMSMADGKAGFALQALF